MKYYCNGVICIVSKNHYLIHTEQKKGIDKIDFRTHIANNLKYVHKGKNCSQIIFCRETFTLTHIPTVIVGTL